jgi:succinate dehydrogenase/fumarate reductase flavoprotein subunit
MTVRLSNLQFNMLRVFATENDTFRMSMTEAGAFDQRPFGSMLAPSRRYILYDRKPTPGGRTGFKITKEGREAYREFETANILRKIASMKLTHYFEPPKMPVSVRKAIAGAA